MDFEKIRNYRNTYNTYIVKQGILLEEVGPGYARIVKTVGANELNMDQRVHGGLFFVMADAAAGAAMVHHGHKAVTVNASWNFLRGAESGAVLTAEAREIKSGKTLCVIDVQLHDQDNRLLGTGSFTYYLLDEPSFC